MPGKKAVFVANVVIVAVILAIVVYSVYSYTRKLRRGGGCCGEHEPAEKKVPVADRHKDHYPYTVRLRIDGMHCGNCARRVENALNRLDGTWAEVDLGSKSATVRCKQPPDAAALGQAVRSAGYVMLGAPEPARP